MGSWGEGLTGIPGLAYCHHGPTLDKQTNQTVDISSAQICSQHSERIDCSYRSTFCLDCAMSWHAGAPGCWENVLIPAVSHSRRHLMSKEVNLQQAIICLKKTVITHNCRENLNVAHLKCYESTAFVFMFSLRYSHFVHGNHYRHGNLSENDFTAELNPVIGKWLTAHFELAWLYLYLQNDVASQTETDEHRRTAC